MSVVRDSKPGLGADVFTLQQISRSLRSAGARASTPGDNLPEVPELSPTGQQILWLLRGAVACPFGAAQRASL